MDSCTDLTVKDTMARMTSSEVARIENIKNVAKMKYEEDEEMDERLGDVAKDLVFEELKETEDEEELFEKKSTNVLVLKEAMLREKVVDETAKVFVEQVQKKALNEIFDETAKDLTEQVQKEALNEIVDDEIEKVSLLENTGKQYHLEDKQGDFSKQVFILS